MSRSENVPIDDITHTYEIQNFYEAVQPCEEPYSYFIHGMWLEGADWNREKCKIFEITKNDRFI